ncbi:GCN5-related N-acetyl-transferase-domain-containing protein [Sporodiniella umbellata]|nr:GCN5-related N-acetyl-transferase-domain-containing protein [Sporodiniella umbellata]
MFKLPLDTDGSIAALCYLPTRSQSLVEFYHTEIPTMYRHQGIGDLLLSRAFQWAKSSEKTVIPTCSFVRKYLTTRLETDV